MSDDRLIEEILDIDTGSGSMAVLRKRPGTGFYPRLVMFHDGPGIRAATHEFASLLAAAGFDVVVPDLYRRHGRMIGYEQHEREADPTLIKQLWRMLESLDDTEIQDDLDVTLAALGFEAGQPLGTIGFCMGARATYRTMMRLPERFVVGAMWHPSYLVDDEPDSPHLTAGALQAPLFIGIGDKDRMQPISTHQPFLDAVSGIEGTEISVFPGVDHGYTWPGWPNYDQPAAGQSFRQTISLFKRYLT